MKSRPVWVLVAVLLVFVTPALAHVPVFATNNDTPDRAYRITDASKSWSIYDTLDAGGVAYYIVELDAGAELRLSVFTPVRGSFTPSLILASPTIESNEGSPVPLPDGYGWERIAGERPPRAEYEPFAPSSFYTTVDIDRRVEQSGPYLIAVYAPEGTGPIGLAVGQREQFTLTEYGRVPLDLVRVHLWEGQSPFVVFGPMALVLVVGGVVGWRHLPTRGPTSIRVAVATAGLLYLATAGGTALQTVLAVTRSGPTGGVVLTLAFVAIPAIVGVALLRWALSEQFELTGGGRVVALLAGAIGFVTWAGLLVGPALLLVVTITPKTGFGVGSR